MAGNFFGFNTDFPSENVLGSKGLEEELLTADVEEEYDALNDETFGCAANDDWEEAHEKLSELIIKKDIRNSVFDDSLLETDESQNEIVSKSISQLGLEDDLDDPAIMTVARNCHSLSHLRPTFRSSSSPPPPAILETEDCGSPKTHSIWSTTPKDSGISSFLQSLNHSSNSYSCHDHSPILNSSTDSVFTTPPKAWHAEDLEKDLLSSSSKEPVHTSNGSWPQVQRGGLQNAKSMSPTPRFPNNLGQNQNKISMDRMLTREEVERQMHANPRLCYPPKVLNQVPSRRIGPMLQSHNIAAAFAPRGTINAPNHSSPVVPLRPPPRGPLIGNGGPIPDRFLVNARMNNIMHNQLPCQSLRDSTLPNLPPGFNPSNINMNSKFLFLPPRSIAHPFLHKQFQFPLVVHNNFYNEEMRSALHTTEDEYAGLMTQKEKDWLIRIQLLLLKSENPYVEDYYFTTQVARRCRKKYSESATKGGDAPELILPETTKHESRAFVPIQFEGSLGKLQAVSVNFPRKVLDITVARSLEDEESKVISNLSLMKYRRLLLDIERLYTHLLEIEDEERRILAKPESGAGNHLATIEKLKKDIYNGLFNDTAEDYFQNVMTIRKGRSLVMRVFKMFNMDQQLQCLVFLFRSLPVILKKDQNDLILVHHVDMITDAIQRFSFDLLVLLGEALEYNGSSESVKGKEKNNFVAALKNKFGSSVICTLLLQAEKLYPDLSALKSDIQARWTKVVMHLVDYLCALPNSSISPPVNPYSNVLQHFQRFAVDRDKFDVLKEKLSCFESGIKSEETEKSV